MNDPLHRRFSAWMSERFPPSHSALFLVLYATALLYGRFGAQEGALRIGLGDVPGFLAVWCFFFMLRIFDEHKDLETDSANHPDRVLQSGLVTLGHLKAAGAAAVALQLGVSLWLDQGLGRITWLWFAVMGWSALMAAEFFCRAWLVERLLLYAFSHMLVMPLALVWMAQMGAGTDPAPAGVGWLALLSFFSGAAFEVTRKTRGPEEERPGVDSYTRALGVNVASLLVIGLLAASAAVQVVLLQSILGSPPWYWYALLLASAALPAAPLLRFRAAPSARGRERNEALVSVSMLAGYVIVLAALLAERGAAWG